MSASPFERTFKKRYYSLDQSGTTLLIHTLEGVYSTTNKMHLLILRDRTGTVLAAEQFHSEEEFKRCIADFEASISEVTLTKGTGGFRNDQSKA